MLDFLAKHAQFVFFLLIAVVAILQKVIEARRAKREEEAHDLEEDFDFSDVFPGGGPESATGPPPIPRVQAAPPPLRRATPAPDPAAAAELARQANIEERMRALRAMKAGATASAAAPPSPPMPRSLTPARPGNRRLISITRQLRNPASARQAVLFKEILGRPVGWRG